MPSLIALGFYAVLAVGGLIAVHSAWSTFTAWIAAPYVTAQIASDQKAVDAAGVRATRAEKQAADSLVDIANCSASLDKQTDLVKRWQVDAAQRLADSQKAKAAAIIANADKNEAIAQLQRIARAPPRKDETCQQQLDGLTKSLRDSARSRLPK